MQNKNHMLFFMIFLACLISSCSNNLKVNQAYFQKIQLGTGMPNIASMDKSKRPTEFVLTLDNPKKKDITIDKVVIHGYEGYDYHFKKPRLSSPNFSKTVLSAKEVKRFSLGLRTDRASSKETAANSTTQAVIHYSNGEKTKTLDITTLQDKGVKKLK